MVGQGQGEHSGKGESLSEGRCPIRMRDGQRCGRAIRYAATGVGEEPVCLMHSRDRGKSDAEFQEEFDRILEKAGDGLADFTGFVFRDSPYDRIKFDASCCFQGATFTQDAEFSHAKFTQDVEFNQSTFDQAAYFNGATLALKADFSNATFKRNASFFDATFAQDAEFIGATFDGDAHLERATFVQGAAFLGVTFGRNADFTRARFTQHASFSGATFNSEARFEQATFKQDALFVKATFKQDADFGESEFAGWVDFRTARFARAAHFDQTKFRRGSLGKGYEPGPVFSVAVFEEPEKVVFYKTDLGQALFHNCDVSKMNFSVVTWRKRANGKGMVFDEAIDLENEASTALRYPEHDPNPRNYRLIAELYQQLKKNYDDRRDYWTAGDFHYGEMEMKRLASDRHDKARRWLHSNLGLVAWYKYASEYGESYVRPALWLVPVLFVFTLLYPVTGLHLDAGRSGTPAAASTSAERLTYRHPLQDGGDTRAIWSARRDLVWNSFVTTLYVAAFQKDSTYQPSYPWGRLLALAEVLLTSTLGALFLLAVRRQFKR